MTHHHVPTAPRRVFRRITDEQPFEVFIAFLCLISGLPLLFKGPTAGSIEASLPHVLVLLWGAELTLGGAVTLIGLAAGRQDIERHGLFLLGAASAVYALVLLYAAWPASIISAAITAGFSLASFARRSSMRRTFTIRTK